MRAQYLASGAVAVTLAEGDTLGHVEGPLDLEIAPVPGLLLWEALRESGIAITPAFPDAPTLSDWRVGLTLWKKPDGTLRIDEVTQKVADLVAAGQPLGRIARERLEYANNVLRTELLQLADALGFVGGDVDESLWRADRVRQGDLSGTWPLAA